MTDIAQEVRSYQQALWDDQHSRRGGNQGLEGEQLVNTPNDAAVLLAQLLSPGSTIAEVGSANGRDARFLARENGHKVICMDFSRVALAQLVELADSQGVSEHILPVQFDANDGKLPADIGEFDAFYARSALHVDDETLMSLLTDINRHLRAEGIVVIEGKSTEDPKIARSKQLGNGLAIDSHENGHIRRVWTQESLDKICKTLGWKAIASHTFDETWVNTDANFLRLVAKK